MLAADEKYNCKTVLIERRFDGCRLTTASLGHVFGAILNDAIVNSINFELKCPYKARTYNITNFRANLNVAIPFPDVGKYCIKAEIYGKPKGKKSFEKAVSFGGSGTFKQFNK